MIEYNVLGILINALKILLTYAHSIKSILVTIDLFLEASHRYLLIDESSGIPLSCLLWWLFSMSSNFFVSDSTISWS